MKTRRHHNNDGRAQIKAGRTAEQVQAIARKLNLPMLRCNRCHRIMRGTTAYDGACSCGGLIEVVK